ncbi:uncharacterized protein LOC132699557 [Cylas formicarius]|uniref:uncharacterized protein LOC132699557 n=1 Tax=Cylas formicarius TaxID=197179 RepID=UPI0029583A0E|nr:uncharacterized protein LOC132699557 [Cylas formicarius]
MYLQFLQEEKRGEEELPPFLEEKLSGDPDTVPHVPFPKICLLWSGAAGATRAIPRAPSAFGYRANEALCDSRAVPCRSCLHFHRVYRHDGVDTPECGSPGDQVTKKIRQRRIVTRFAQIKILKMTSPAINNGNGQKDSSKSTSSATLNQPASSNGTPQTSSTSTPPLTAWWRVFKMVNVLTHQNC